MNKTNNIKEIFINFIILLLLIITVLNIYFGILLPYKKSTYLIYGLQALRNGKIQNLDDFKKVFSEVLDLKSYVGQEEAVKVIGQYVVSIISSAEISQEEKKDLINFFEPYYLEKELFHKIIFAKIYGIYYKLSQDENYFKKAEGIYLSIINEGPQLPVGYLGLFEFYLENEKYQQAKEVGEKILNYWPNFLEIQEKISQLN